MSAAAVVEKFSRSRIVLFRTAHHAGYDVVRADTFDQTAKMLKTEDEHISFILCGYTKETALPFLTYLTDLGFQRMPIIFVPDTELPKELLDENLQLMSDEEIFGQFINAALLTIPIYANVLQKKLVSLQKKINSGRKEQPEHSVAAA